LVLAIVVAGCGGDGSSDPTATGNADGAGLVDSGGIHFGDSSVSSDAGASDSAAVAGDGGGAGADGAADDGGATAADAGGACEFASNPSAGEPGAPCSGPEACDSGWCVDGPAGKVCSRTCVECCPGGWKCEQAPASDAVFICMPKFGALCGPCSADAVCGDVSKGALCVKYNDGAAHFCGGECAEDVDCPAGFGCVDAKGTQGQAKQCVRKAGLCPCTAKASASGAESLCVVSNEHGTCTGSRKCEGDTFTDCGAATPAAETCNGQDDDCDGQTDEEAPLSDCPVTNEHGTCPGSQSCVEGKLLCDGKTPEAEICDGLDNNCDGKTDEGCDDDQDGWCKTGATIAGLPAACSQDLAACNSGGLPLPKWCAKGVLDCNDGDAKVHPGQAEFCGNQVDDDCDGETDADADGSSVKLDGCKTFYNDTDTDGYGDLAFKCLCAPSGTWTATNNTDCDDKDAKVNPKQKEICNNNKDDDCDKKDNGYDAINCVSFWTDVDGDGYGTGKPACACAPIDGYKATKGGDCDDKKAAIHPKVVEACDGLDNNCNGATDEPDAKGCKAWYADSDKDTFGDPKKSACLCAAKAPFLTLQGKDCDDGKYNVNPGFKEQCGDSLDNDCNGKTDEEGGKNCSQLFYDGDGDKFGAKGKSKCLCDAANGYNVTKGGDCDDKVKTIHPEAVEICDGKDNNCDTKTDEACNVDGDGWCAKGKVVVGKPPICPKGGGDCNDGNKAIHPTAKEICNGKDDDCVKGVDQGCDDDGDGWCDKNMVTIGKPTVCKKGGGDCHDGKKGVNPAAKEICDSIDNNCAKGVDEGCDDDNDGWCDSKMVVVGKPKTCTKGPGDCCDTDNKTWPGQTGWYTNKNLCGSFDYNCKSGWQRKDVIVAKPAWKCGGFACTSSSCNAQPKGWDLSVPSCGVKKLWITDYDWNGNVDFPAVKVCTVKKGVQKTQACH